MADSFGFADAISMTLSRLSTTCMSKLDGVGHRAPNRMPRPMPRLVLILIAAVAVLGMTACGDDEGSAHAGHEQAATQTETAPTEDGLKDTSTKPEIPKPTGIPPRRLVKHDIVKGTG